MSETHGSGFGLAFAHRPLCFRMALASSWVPALEKYLVASHASPCQPLPATPFALGVQMQRPTSPYGGWKESQNSTSFRLVEGFQLVPAYHPGTSGEAEVFLGELFRHLVLLMQSHHTTVLSDVISQMKVYFMAPAESLRHQERANLQTLRP
jgi:hypothetical protein